jgi:transcriptional regulator with XRE-family HTH domain
MSQHKKLEFAERVRAFRGRAKLSQGELAGRLGVSGNYVSMIELGKKLPGATLRKLFDTFEQSPQYQAPAQMSGGRRASDSGIAGVAPANSLLAMVPTERLILIFMDLAEQLSPADAAKQKLVLGNLRELLDELEQRLLASSGPLSEAQRIALQAAKSGGHPGTK